MRTWAPRGQTPVLQYTFNWKCLSAIAGITIWNFYFQLFPGSIKAPQLLIFLRHLRRHIPGKLTMPPGGLYAIYGLNHEHRDVKAAGGLGLALLADYLASENSGGPTHTEMILTTTVASGGRYLARKTDVYYVEEPDIGLFARAPGRDMKVVSE